MFFSGRVTPLFETMIVQAPEELGEGSEIPTDPQHLLTIIQPSTSQPQKKQPRRKQRKDIEVPQPSGFTEPITDEAANEEHVHVHSNDPLLSGEDRLKLNELIKLCTNLSKRVLDLENTKTSQAAEIAKLKMKVKKLERRSKSRTPRLKRLKKVGRTTRIESSENEGLGAQEDASKHGRKIADFDADAELLLERDVGRPLIALSTISTLLNSGAQQVRINWVRTGTQWVRTLVEMDIVQPILHDIMLWFQPVASKRTFQVVVGKMLLAATSYFIWRERNNGLFKDTRRPPEEIRDLIMMTVRLKLISFRFKITPRVQRLLALWKMPSNFRLYGVE
ncbi:hypothetical protein Tco_0567693 [Tanacetum coccineum]